VPPATSHNLTFFLFVCANLLVLPLALAINANSLTHSLTHSVSVSVSVMAVCRKSIMTVTRDATQLFEVLDSDEDGRVSKQEFVQVTHSLTHSLTHLLIYSFTHLLIYSFTHLLIHSSTPTRAYSGTHALTHSLTYLL
jgi:hypothetical protein